MSLAIGSQKRTTDGVIGTSGKKIRLYGLIVRAGGSDTVVELYNGTSASDTLVDTINGAADTTTRVMFAGGLFLGSGCFLNLDANISFVTAIFEQENS